MMIGKTWKSERYSETLLTVSDGLAATYARFGDCTMVLIDIV